MVTTNKLQIGIDNEVVELKGEEKEVFELDRKQMQDKHLLLETKQEEKRVARANAITKLAEIAGLTEEEINSIL